MKEKFKIIILLLALSAYLAFTMYLAHGEWEKGLSREQIEREDMLIW